MPLLTRHPAMPQLSKTFKKKKKKRKGIAHWWVNVSYTEGMDTGATENEANNGCLQPFLFFHFVSLAKRKGNLTDALADVVRQKVQATMSKPNMSEGGVLLFQQQVGNVQNAQTRTQVDKCHS